MDRPILIITVFILLLKCCSIESEIREINKKLNNQPVTSTADEINKAYDKIFEWLKTH